jgi:hypothetical protein
MGHRIACVHVMREWSGFGVVPAHVWAWTSELRALGHARELRTDRHDIWSEIGAGRGIYVCARKQRRMLVPCVYPPVPQPHSFVLIRQPRSSVATHCLRPFPHRVLVS